jgi:hypothetical protein
MSQFLKVKLHGFRIRRSSPVERDELADVLLEGVILVHGRSHGRLLRTHDLRQEADPHTHFTVRPVGQVGGQPSNVGVRVVLGLKKGLSKMEIIPNYGNSRRPS